MENCTFLKNQLRKFVSDKVLSRFKEFPIKTFQNNILKTLGNWEKLTETSMIISV